MELDKGHNRGRRKTARNNRRSDNDTIRPIRRDEPGPVAPINRNSQSKWKSSVAKFEEMDETVAAPFCVAITAEED